MPRDAGVKKKKKKRRRRRERRVRLSSSLERKNEKKNDEFWISWTFFQKSKMKKKPKKEPAKKVWCLVIKMIKDKKRGKPIIRWCVV